jgi:hypothetical protein
VIRKLVLVAALLGGLFAAPVANAAQDDTTDKRSATAPADVTPQHCSHFWRDADPRSGRLVLGTNTRLREAPHVNSCAVLGLLQPSDSVDFHCWAFGEPVNGTDTWTHLRVLSGPNAGKQGWVHDSLLVGFGSPVRC